MATNDLMKYFKYKHLPEKLQKISKEYSITANKMDSILPDGAEKDTALRKLLESKDCAVRSVL